MGEHKRQVDIIAGILEREGRISRNQCLRMYISRLAARIAEVGNDYEYRVIERPKAEKLVLV